MIQCPIFKNVEVQPLAYTSALPVFVPDSFAQPAGDENKKPTNRSNKLKHRFT